MSGQTPHRTPPGSPHSAPHDAPAGPPPVLEQILRHKREEIACARANTPEAELRALAAAQPPPRDFVAAVTTGRRRPIAAIAEVKRQSPSAGLIRPEYAGDGFEPEAIARGYSDSGASAISCLTDERFFGGSPSYIQRIRGAIALPVLRKDFLIDPWQVLESRAIGADAVLLIAECLPPDRLAALAQLARELGMAVLLEAHTSENLATALDVARALDDGGWLLGVNNRDLTQMTTDLGRTIGSIERGEVPSWALTRLVSESGIRTPADVRRLARAGVGILLVGEHPMRQADPGAALAALLAEAPEPGPEHGAAAPEATPDPAPEKG